jgi:serine/threonine-protein kinase
MLKPDQIFGNFRIEKKLGEGGMGAVYLAEDQKLHRKVALKILLAEYFDNTEHRERFFREAKTAAQVTNSNVMSIYDLGSAPHPESGQELNYICMEYIDGTSLSALLRERRLDMAALLRLSGKIASGLSAAHQKGIVHRDIKADNIIVDAEMEPKILDFGLAKPADPVQFEDKEDSTRSISQDLTKAGKILGTVSYMSPEQVRGEKVDSRSDIFSFGILLYQMATGEMPFAAKTHVSTLAKILETQPEPPHIKNTDIPPELERIITKCLQKDAADRYQDTRDLVVDLRNLRRQYDSGISDSFTGSYDRPDVGGKKTFNINLSWKLVIVVALGMILVYNLIDGCIPDSSDPSQRETAKMSGTEIRDAIMKARALQGTGQTLAILDFSNKTGDNSFEWLATGLPEIMLTGLTQSNALAVISSARILDNLGKDADEEYSREDFIESAQELGADRLLSGSYFKVGDKLGITAQLEDIETGTVVISQRVIGIDPLPLVDSLTMKIADALDATGRMAREVGSMQFAASAEAYKPYHEGMIFFGESRWDEAISKFEEALAIDSTFGLPYMRIGMVKVFTGKQQDGARYLLKALRFRDELPRRDREKLDIYADLWQRQQFQQSMEKVSHYVKSYPDDTEARSIYGILLNNFANDTVAAFAQFDTVLAQEPSNAFTLQQLAQIRESYKQYDLAVENWEHLVESFPRSISYKTQLADLYRQLGKFAGARRLLIEARDLDPKDANPLASLVSLAIYENDLAEAEKYLDEFKAKFGDDPYEMNEYYGMLGNIAIWRGQFVKSLAFRHLAIEEGKKSGDNNLIWSGYHTLAGYQDRFDMRDSARFYYNKCYEVANPFQRVNYGIAMVELDNNRVEEIRPIFRRDMQEFRSRLPAQFQPLADGLDSIFDAVAAADTARQIRAIELVQSSQAGQNSANEQSLGQSLVQTGQYRKGIDKLLPFVEGPERSITAWTYLSLCYYLGIGYEGLGDSKKAAEYYREMLTYWGDADIQVKEILDAKQRLARITS